VAVATVVDSAARRRHQASLARSEANTLAMLNRTVLGGEYGVPQLLELVRDTFGAESAELVGNDFDVPSGATAAPATQQSLLVLRGRSLTAAEHRVLAAFARHLGVLREREELARQTAAARELEAGNRTRTALLAAVSHDLRTPLAGIRAAAETLRRNDARLATADRADLLAAIEESTGRLTTLVTDLLDMSRLQTGAVQPVFTEVGLDDVVRRALVGVAGTERVQVADPLPVVRADFALLGRVVANLVNNALRHTDGAVEVIGQPAGQRVRLAVVDHGPGVPLSQRTRMFEPFQRLGDNPRGGGVGLGLAVARGLAEAQGGTMLVEDTPGGGLTMVVDLAGTE
jgi:two-component system, OmpR family, sensor histidine kinase KdpD